MAKPYFNPLSPNGDQRQFSPNNIHTSPREKSYENQENDHQEKMP